MACAKKSFFIVTVGILICAGANSCRARVSSGGASETAVALSYPVVDTGQTRCYDESGEMAAPAPGEAFYGQDAQHAGHAPSFTDNGDGTVTDNVTGLMWSQSPDLDGDGDIDAADKRSHAEALAGAASFFLAGYDDWRLPTIKELYSLMDFRGVDPSGYTGTDTAGLIPFIDTNFFDFGYGDTAAGERIIDAQFASATLYVGEAMMAEAMFGVNLADGRIKGYPTGSANPGQTEPKRYYVLYVRGNLAYGINDLIDNGDGTVTDRATGLMWQQDDSWSGLDWAEALAWVEEKNGENHLGYSDWRLPNAKELQSIVHYTRAPAVTGTPAIDPVFACSTILDEGGDLNYPFYWSSTTHANMTGGGYAAYVAFGEALGWMRDPFGNYRLMDVHGAGAQRSDPKAGDPADWPWGHGPQGDVIRIYNHVRLVRDVVIDPVDGDLDGDGQAGATDLLLLAGALAENMALSPGTAGRADLDGSGVIGVLDLMMLLFLVTA